MNMTGALILLCLYMSVASAAKTKVGSFSNTQHGVAGTVYVLDDTKILIEGFTYDGSAPDAFFYVGKAGAPSESGYRVPYPKGTDRILERYDGEDVTIELQNGWKTSDLKWLSVWCRQFSINFGDVAMDRVEPPNMTKVGDLSELDHGVSGTVFIEDESTIIIEDFTYDGEAPDAFFYVGKSGKPSETGKRIAYPEGDFDAVLQKFGGEDVTIKMPDGWKTSELKWLSVWCRQFKINFGDVYFDGSSSGADTIPVVSTMALLPLLALSIIEALF